MFYFSKVGRWTIDRYICQYLRQAAAKSTKKNLTASGASRGPPCQEIAQLVTVKISDSCSMVAYNLSRLSANNRGPRRRPPPGMGSNIFQHFIRCLFYQLEGARDPTKKKKASRNEEVCRRLEVSARNKTRKAKKIEPGERKQHRERKKGKPLKKSSSPTPHDKTLIKSEILKASQNK